MAELAERIRRFFRLAIRMSFEAVWGCLGSASRGGAAEKEGLDDAAFHLGATAAERGRKRIRFLSTWWSFAVADEEGRLLGEYFMLAAPCGRLFLFFQTGVSRICTSGTICFRREVPVVRGAFFGFLNC